MTLSSGQFWFTMFIVLIILLFPVIAIRFYNIVQNPTLSDRCRSKQRELKKKALSHHLEHFVRRKSSAFRSRRSIRSGYAFAHQEGFGQLITSGQIMPKHKSYSLNVPNKQFNEHPHHHHHHSHHANQSSKHSSTMPRNVLNSKHQHSQHHRSKIEPISYNPNMDTF